MNRQERRAMERKARKEARKELKVAERSEAPSPTPDPTSQTPGQAASAAPQSPASAYLDPSTAALKERVGRMLANYCNAQKSTGPRTPEGKGVSSQNNFRHGLRGAFKVLPNEDESEFRNLLRSLREEHKPATPTEELLVQQMAEHFWLTRRAKGFQDTMLLNPETFTIKMMNMWMRYETQHQRAFHKCLADLLKLREEKRKAEAHASKIAVRLRAQMDEAALPQRAEDSSNGFEWNRQRKELHELKKRIATAQSEALESKKSPETTGIRATSEATGA